MTHLDRLRQAMAANDDELELGGRTLLAALWEDPLSFSRNRHYAALQTRQGRADRAQIVRCRRALEALRRGLSVEVRGERVGVRLMWQQARSRQEVVISHEALRLLISHPEAQALRERCRQLAQETGAREKFS